MRVRLDPDEIERIERFGVELGVDGAVRDGHLGETNSRCVFLGEGSKCRIHGTYGGPAKPKVCQQFPIVRTTAEDGIRLGIDPGCYTAWHTWTQAPEVDLDPDTLLGAVKELPPNEAQAERSLLGLLHHPGLTLTGALATLAGGTPDDPLPAAFAARWITHLQSIDREALFAHLPGPGQKQVLAQMLDAIPTWDPAAPPQLELSADMDAWALETAKRMLFLRLTPTQLRSIGGVLLVLGGALSLGWTHPAPDRFGPALAGWMLAIRSPHVWSRVLPEPATINQLLAG
jgi:hypothetical protein